MKTFLKISLVVIVFMLSIFGSLASAVYLVINIQEAFRPKISQQIVPVNDIPSEEHEQQQVIPRPDNMETRGKWGAILNITWPNFVNFLRRWSIDLSLVTPILLLWFCVSLAAYSGRLIWLYLFARASDDQNRRLKLHAWTFALVTESWFPPFLRTNTDTFPFYRNYETIFVQAGFIGTIWGFLMVGWNMGLASGKAAKGLDIVETLMQAFGTALVSTFTAVVLVYVVGPVVQGFFHWMIGFADALAPEEQMKRFNDSVAQTISGFSTFKAEITSLTTIFGDIKTLISETLEDAVTKTIIRLDKENAPTQKALLKVLQEIKEQQGKKQDAIITHIEYMSRKLDALTSQVQQSSEMLPEKLENVYTAIGEQTNMIQQGNKELHTAIHEQTQLLQMKAEELTRSLQQNHDALQKNNSSLGRLMSYFSRIFKGFGEDKTQEEQSL